MSPVTNYVITVPKLEDLNTQQFDLKLRSDLIPEEHGERGGTHHLRWRRSLPPPRTYYSQIAETVIWRRNDPSSVSLLSIEGSASMNNFWASSALPGIS